MDINLKYNLNDLNFENFERVSVLEKQFFILEKDKNYKPFGCIDLLKNKNGLIIMRKKLLLNNKYDLKEFINKIKSKNMNNCNYIQSILDISIYKNKSICFTNYSVNIFIEYYDINLKNIILDKKSDNLDFNNVELTHILYQIGLANWNLEKNNSNSGNIRPDNIFFNKDQGLLKLVNNSFEILDCDSYYYNSWKNDLLNNKNIYITPQLFQNICKPRKNFKYDKNKADIFSLGLIILTLGLNKNSNELYNINSGIFDDEKLKIWIEVFIDKYIRDKNDLLVSTVENLWIIFENERINFKELFDKLPLYEEIINYFNNKDIIKEENFMTENLNEIEEETSTILFNKDIKSLNFSKITFSESLPLGKNKIINGVEYIWDEEFERHYYFDKKTKDYEWYYDSEELENIKNNNL